MSAMATAQHFEAIKYSLRQSKDGVVVAFVVQPHDVTPELMALAVGARVMVAWSAISDDEKPVVEEVRQAPVSLTTAPQSSRKLTGQATDKPKRKFSELSLPEQAGIRCEDARFEEFLREEIYPTGAVEFDVVYLVRDFCKVASRADLAGAAGDRWRSLESAYQRWLTDKAYADSVR